MFGAEKERWFSPVTFGVVLLSAILNLGAAANAASPSAPADSVETYLTDSGIAVIVPIVATSITRDYVDREELEAKTAPGGDWYQLERAANRHGASIAVDSAILASIAEWGSDSPGSVKLWLQRVMSNNPIILLWGNADPFVFGITGGQNRISAIQMAELASLKTKELVGWVTGYAGNLESVSRTDSLGFSRLIADDATFPRDAGTLSRAANEYVAEVVKPDDSTDLVVAADQAIALMNGKTALSLPTNSNHVDVLRVEEFLDSLEARQDIVHYLPLSTATLGEPQITGELRESVRSLMFVHQRDVRVAKVGLDPTVILEPRTRELAMVAGRVASADFPRYVRGIEKNHLESSDIVSLELGADYTILADNADLPLSLTNNTETDLTLVLTARSKSGILVIDSAEQTVELPAATSTRITIPVTVLANGATEIIVSLKNVDGISLGKPTSLSVSVSAQWEAVTLWSFVSLVSIILGIGVFRTIRERRHSSV